MSVIERIEETKAGFKDSNYSAPKWLILSPQAYEELKFETSGGEEDIEVSFFKTVNSYKGLKIAVTPSNSSTDIAVC